MNWDHYKPSPQFIFQDFYEKDKNVQNIMASLYSTCLDRNDYVHDGNNIDPCKSRISAIMPNKNKFVLLIFPEFDHLGCFREDISDRSFV